MKIRMIAVALVMAFVVPVLAQSSSGEWGNITGTFVFDGEVPKASKINVTKDQEVCGIHNLVDGSLAVNAENKGISNVIVYMYLGKKDAPPAVHESYNETAEAEVVFDNKNCEFTPRVALLRTSQTLLIGNKDTAGHNTKIACLKNKEFNNIVPGNGELKTQFGKAERLPVQVSCSIHPWMKGWLVVKDNPYFAVSDADGNFEIKNVPVGEWTFQVWHEMSGYVDQVTKDGKSEKWKKGRVSIKVEGGDVNLGEITVAAATFDG